MISWPRIGENGFAQKVLDGLQELERLIVTSAALARAEAVSQSAINGEAHILRLEERLAVAEDRIAQLEQRRGR